MQLGGGKLCLRRNKKFPKKQFCWSVHFLRCYIQNWTTWSLIKELLNRATLLYWARDGMSRLFAFFSLSNPPAWSSSSHRTRQSPSSRNRPRPAPPGSPPAPPRWGGRATRRWDPSKCPCWWTLGPPCHIACEEDKLKGKGRTRLASQYEGALYEIEV